MTHVPTVAVAMVSGGRLYVRLPDQSVLLCSAPLPHNFGTRDVEQTLRQLAGSRLRSLSHLVLLTRTHQPEELRLASIRRGTGCVAVSQLAHMLGLPVTTSLVGDALFASLDRDTSWLGGEMCVVVAEDDPDDQGGWLSLYIPGDDKVVTLQVNLTEPLTLAPASLGKSVGGFAGDKRLTHLWTPAGFGSAAYGATSAFWEAFVVMTRSRQRVDVFPWTTSMRVFARAAVPASVSAYA